MIITITLAIIFAFLLLCFIFSLRDSNKVYKEFVIFLKKENDILGLKKIGCINITGEETGRRQRFIYSQAYDYLMSMYKKTNKKEYLDYAEHLKDMQNSTFGFLIALIVISVIIRISLG